MYISQGGELSKPDKSRSAWRVFFSSTWFFISTVILVLLLVNFVFRTYQVSGQSMNNTLHDGQKLIIWKGERTLARIDGHEYIPERGDIIVFNQQNLSACGRTDESQLIKRVIGLPGERIVMKKGVYTVYNSNNLDGFNPDQNSSDSHKILTSSGELNVTLTDHQLFVSGDNRPNSCDSRSFGPIDVDQVVGKLLFQF
jgi:signal peptidase I